VAEDSHELLGFMTLGGCRDADVELATTGEIWGIYLAPRHWRKGLGRRLCQCAEEMLNSRHYRQAMLWVLEDNDSARRFYEALGFQIDGAAKTLHLGTPLKAVRYRKELNRAEATGAANAAPPHR